MKKGKPHGVQLLVRAVVRDPDGKIISDTGRKPAKSFVIQFLEFFCLLFDPPYGDSYRTATDGTEDRFYTSIFALERFLQVNAGVGASGWGVVVGTGDTAPDNTNYKLETQLTQGVGAGNISHASVIITATAVVGPNVDLEVKRAFTNLTGSAIGVKEAGIYTRCDYAGPWYHCIVRDVLPGTVNVPDKCSLTVYYTIRTTV